MNTKRLATSIGVVVLIFIAAFVLQSTREEEVSLSNDSASSPAIETAKASAPVSETVKRAESAYTRTRVQEGKKYITTINYVGRSFDPQIVSVRAGESVRFVNLSNTGMRIRSNEVSGVPLFSGLNQEQTVGKNGTYEVTFTEKGVWGYHNLTDNTVIGIVYVK